MMLLLVYYIPLQTIYSRVTYRESPIAILPVEVLIMHSLRFNPLRRTLLDFLNQICQSHGFWQCTEHVNMVRSSSNLQRIGFVVLQDSSKIGIEFVFNIFPNKLNIIFCMKNNMNINLNK